MYEKVDLTTIRSRRLDYLPDEQRSYVDETPKNQNEPQQLLAIQDA